MIVGYRIKVTENQTSEMRHDIYKISNNVRVCQNKNDEGAFIAHGVGGIQGKNETQIESVLEQVSPLQCSVDKFSQESQ